jgi:RHS repeat-associated protein
LISPPPNAQTTRRSTTANSRLFVGEEFDQDLALIHLRARQYKSDIGRFTTIDPRTISQHDPPTEPTALNNYLYANAIPTTLIDPSGNGAAPEYAIQTRGSSMTVQPVKNIGWKAASKLVCIERFWKQAEFCFSQDSYFVFHSDPGICFMIAYAKYLRCN